jgi:tetratricopeptide (TPR) repeat protein
MRRGRFAGAVEDYTHALQFKRDGDLLAHRGWAYFFADAWKLAEGDFNEAIHLSRRNKDALVGRGLARVMLGDYRRAAADAEEARGKKPSTPEMMHNLACLFAQAAARVKADTAEPQRSALEVRYGRQAVEALRNTLALLPVEQRLAFWQEKMRPDPALDPIRACADFTQLDGEVKGAYSPKGRTAKNPGDPPGS